MNVKRKSCLSCDKNFLAEEVVGYVGPNEYQFVPVDLNLLNVTWHYLERLFFCLFSTPGAHPLSLFQGALDDLGGFKGTEYLPRCRCSSTDNLLIFEITTTFRREWRDPSPFRSLQQPNCTQKVVSTLRAAHLELDERAKHPKGRTVVQA